MVSSLIAGFSASEIMSADGVLIMLADMPGLTADYLVMVIRLLRMVAARLSPVPLFMADAEIPLFSRSRCVSL
jgi:CTP:molybdopterin cytidylyltransferase MocA